MTDRLHCINPLCRRTESKLKFPYSDEIVCGKCWKNVPARDKIVYRGLRKQWRAHEKYELRTGERIEESYQWLAEQMALNWSKIRTFYAVKPEFPAGLEGFLKEMGFDE